ncbi:antitoxin Xre/MbcA/ParS toxin-binding domain-containing protein [Marinobacter sp. MIT932201]|jgi:putative toxin-antitoxin system antitoxin component (TIGR02293 family)
MTRKLLFGCIPDELFSNPEAFISAVRSGAPGQWLASMIQSTGLQEGIGNALAMNPDQLVLACQSDALSRRTTESMLDVARVLKAGEATWGSQEKSIEWLVSSVPALADNSPLNLMDTFEGRRWVMQTLRKIEYGDFS